MHYDNGDKTVAAKQWNDKRAIRFDKRNLGWLWAGMG